MKILELSNGSGSMLAIILESKKEGQDLLLALAGGITGTKLRANTRAYKMAKKIDGELPCW